MSMLIKILSFLALLSCTYSNLHTRYETRYCTEDQMGGSNTQFAARLKDYVYSCPTKSGYCIFENPDYPIQNKKSCGSNENIGWIITYTFNEAFPANYEIDWGTDFGGGSAIYVNGVLDVAYQQDFWWEFDWNSVGVFNLNYDFPAGENTILVVANEFCCDGPMQVQFSRNGGPKKPLTKANFQCQQNNSCDGVNCNTNEYKVGFECKACGYKCKTCEGSANQCLTCNDSENRIQAPNCDCKAGYYNVEGNKNCQRCHSSCATCTNGNSCDTCPPHHYKNTLCYSCATAHGDNNCGTCNATECLTCKNFPDNYLPLCTSQTCLTNQYLVGKICKNCPSTCKTCIDSTGCSTCEDNEYMENRQCKSCETKYGSHCGTCTKFQCLTCKVNASYKLPDCTSPTCPEGKQTDGNVCRDCINGCKTCSNSSTCEECFDGYFKTGSETCSPCTPPCLTCQGSGSTCLSCTKANFSISSGCTECIDRFHKTSSDQCASCVEFYGEKCGVCSEIECTRCHSPDSNMLPACSSTNCPIKTWKDGYICRDCISNCLVCSNGSTCDKCIDLYYKADDGTCKECSGACLLCTAPTVCTLCKERGWAPPSCNTCGQGWFMHEGACIQSCPSKFYGRNSDNTCQPCDDSCFDCENDAYYCTICPNEKFLYNGKCVDCDDVIGMEQDPEEPKGVCREICGDGKRLVPASIHQCDDGNNIDGDGCNSNCEIEEGWICNGGSIAYPDVCNDKRPIGFKVDFAIDEEYLNIEENASISAVMVFNKTFTLPAQRTLKDFIVLTIEGKDTSGFKIAVKERIGRLLAEENPTYDLTIEFDQTIRQRELAIDLYPKSAFQDGSGNILADQPSQKGEVKDYFYYNEEERDNTALFEFWMQISVLALMCFLPIYVFYYKNHFNRFYVIFMIIDCTQTLYFYRFLNIRWAINGIKFYRKLRPVIGFYMPNFYEKSIADEDFEDYSSGVTKFDKEKESALFMNNTGSILTLLFIYIFCYLVVVILSQPKLYVNKQEHKVYNFFYQFRYGYLQWGVWFDSMMASSGVFIIYILLQMTNPLADIANTSIAIGVAIFYFGFFIVVARYISQNLKNLYTITKDEVVDGMSMEEKLQNNPTFKLRNAWHFVHNLEHLPQKGYFYYMFLIRKVYLSSILLIFQEHPTIQLLMSSFSHLIVIILLLKYRFFVEQKETFKAILSETLIFIAIGCMYFMLDDVSEEESYRLTFSWIVLALLLLSLFIHGVYFLYNEIFEPFIRLITKKKHDQKRVIDLRTLRKEGKLVGNEGNENNEESSSVGTQKKAGYERADSKENTMLFVKNGVSQFQEKLTTDSPIQEGAQLNRVKRNHTRKNNGQKSQSNTLIQSTQSADFDAAFESNEETGTRKNRFAKSSERGTRIENDGQNSPSNQENEKFVENQGKSKFYNNNNNNGSDGDNGEFNKEEFF